MFVFIVSIGVLSVSIENGAKVSSKTALPVGMAANTKQNVGDETFKSYDERDPTKVTATNVVSVLVSNRRQIRPPKICRRYQNRVANYSERLFLAILDEKAPSSLKTSSSILMINTNRLSTGLRKNRSLATKILSR